MRKTMFVRYLVLVLIAVLVCGGVTFAVTSRASVEEQQDKMLDMLHVMELYYEQSEDVSIAKQLSESAQGARITIIAPDGTVLDDSEADHTQMGNHLERKEVADAIKNGSGVEIRSSRTVVTRQMYVAYRLSDGVILRMSLETSAIENYAYQLFPAILVVFLVAFVVSSLVVSKIVDKIVTPLDDVKTTMVSLGDGRVRENVPEGEFEELNGVIRVFNSLSEKIQQASSSLEIEQQKIDFILHSMNEGLVLVDSSLSIIHANPASKRFFRCDYEVQNENILYLIHSIKVNEAIESAVKNQVSQLFDIQSPSGTDSILQVHVTPIQSEFLGTGAHSSGAIMVISDVTTQRRTQQMKQEFFSNCSHELKTPITSIQGFADILQSGIADEQHTQEYIDRILSEAKRMSVLIEDILKISRLESGTDTSSIVKLPISLRPLCEEICQNLHPQASQMDITLSVSGDDCVIYADKTHMYELCTDLIENAVKYNRKGGSVNCTLSYIAENKKVVIEVKDTGIGIPLVDQNRIFERFYRVDRGRSTKLGSTGLGLSIVKHIIGVYGGAISLHSRENVGTTISVTLPV